MASEGTHNEEKIDEMDIPKGPLGTPHKTYFPCRNSELKWTAS